MTAKQTNSKIMLNSFKTELNNTESDLTKFTVMFDGDIMKKIKLLQKKYNYRTISQLLRDLVNTYYNDDFINK